MARASDTIADEGKISFSEREKTLTLLKSVAKGKAEGLLLWKKSEQWKNFSQQEQQLIEQLPEMLALLQSEKYSAFEVACINEVWEKILEGQLMDLRYQQERKNFSADELEKYLYLVAGSVGEFLTRLAHEAFPNFAITSLKMLENLAVDYGKGLQLVNLLRDFSHDQRQERFYFLEKEKAFYHTQANKYLQQGRIYVNALNPGRMKAAFALPLLLGQQTLALLKKHPNVERLKISRWRVYLTLLFAAQYFFKGAIGATPKGRDHSKIPGEVF